jgi:hypothetical protein
MKAAETIPINLFGLIAATPTVAKVIVTVNWMAALRVWRG